MVNLSTGEAITSFLWKPGWTDKVVLGAVNQTVNFKVLWLYE